MSRSSQELLNELRDIKLTAMELTALAEDCEAAVIKQLEYLKENKDKLSFDEFKASWDKSKELAKMAETHRKEWENLQNRLIQVDKELKSLEIIGKSTLH